MFIGLKKTTTKLHVTWEHASAHQLKRVWADSDQETMGLAHYVDGASGQCVTRRAPDKAPRSPVPGAPHGFDIFCNNPPLASVRCQDPQEVRSVFRGSRIAIFGWPKCIQMDDGGGWGNEIWADICPGRRVSSTFRDRARTLRPVNEEMDLHVALIIGWRRMVLYPASRFPPRFSCARIHFFLPVGIRPINLFSLQPCRSLWMGGR